MMQTDNDDNVDNAENAGDADNVDDAASDNLAKLFGRTLSTRKIHSQIIKSNIEHRIGK